MPAKITIAATGTSATNNFLRNFRLASRCISLAPPCDSQANGVAIILRARFPRIAHTQHKGARDGRCYAALADNVPPKIAEGHGPSTRRESFVRPVAAKEPVQARTDVAALTNEKPRNLKSSTAKSVAEEKPRMSENKQSPNTGITLIRESCE